MSAVKIPTTLVGLTTRHNFHKGRIDYSIDLVILGKKFSVPVPEDFVARLDSMLESDVITQQPDHHQHSDHAFEDEQEPTPAGYSLGSWEREPEDYTYEEISNL